MIELCKSLLDKYEIIDVVKLTKGFSRDVKYIMSNKENKYLLRISNMSLYNKKSNQYALLKEIENLNINTSKPVEFGVLNEKYCYMILSWLEGVDAEEAVLKVSDKEAYELGLEAGKILYQLHNIKVDQSNEPSWWEKYQAKVDKKINSLLTCDLTIPMQDEILKYYKDNIYLMKDRPQCLCHGDYHVGNMIVNNGKIGIIDFDKYNFSDPYDEFKPFCWNVMKSEYFETGLINGYFDGKIPEDFFKILKFYTAESMISHLPWAIQFGEKEIEVMKNINNMQMKWWDNFKLDVPTWYKGIL